MVPLRKDININLSFQIIQNMNLFILRHGEAGKFSDGNDFVRPLTDAGATDVTHVAEWLKDLDAVPELVSILPDVKTTNDIIKKPVALEDFISAVKNVLDH
jgi:broad specificity phosphatase PhoE